MRLSWQLLRCRIGWHRWQWKCETEVPDESGEILVTDYGRCVNPLCSYGQWAVMNVEYTPNLRAKAR